jgi:hypothetical protein
MTFTMLALTERTVARLCFDVKLSDSATLANTMVTSGRGAWL